MAQIEEDCKLKCTVTPPLGGAYGQNGHLYPKIGVFDRFFSRFRSSQYLEKTKKKFEFQITSIEKNKNVTWQAPSGDKRTLKNFLQDFPRCNLYQLFAICKENDTDEMIKSYRKHESDLAIVSDADNKSDHETEIERKKVLMPEEKAVEYNSEIESDFVIKPDLVYASDDQTTESDPETEFHSETEFNPETQSDQGTESDPETESTPETESDPETEPNQGTESDPGKESDPGTESDPETETDLITKSDPGTEHNQETKQK